MSTPESDMERALADANELSNRFISSASQFRLTEADTLNVIGVCRALIACQEPVREKEFYFEFPNSTDKCGPYESVDAAKKDSAYGKWKLLWRYRRIPAGEWNQVEP